MKKLADKAMQSKWGRLGILIMGACISVICLYLAFQKIDLKNFSRHLFAMNIGALLAAIALMQFNNFILAKRWALLLQPLKYVPYWTAFWSLRISFFFNATLPARLGEPFRIFYVNRKTKLPMTKAIGAMAADRFIDFTTMLAVLYVSVIVLGIRGSLATTKTIAASLVLGILTLLALAKLPRGSKWTWLDRVLKVRASIFEGMTPLLRWKTLLPTLPLSFLAWFFHGLTIVIFSYGVGEPISLFKAFVVVASVTVAIAIPSSPGHIGTFELGAMTALRYFGVPFEAAATIAVLYHMVQLIPTLLIGAYGYYFHFLKLPQKKVSSSDNKTTHLQSSKQEFILDFDMPSTNSSENETSKIVYH